MRSLLLFLPLCLFSQDLFILPEQHTLLSHQLNAQLERAKKHVHIFTQKLDDYTLQKSLKKLPTKGITLTLISADAPNANNRIHQLNLLKNVELYQLKSPFAPKGSMLCIDEYTLYLFGTDLTQEQLRSHPSFASVQHHDCNTLFAKLIERSVKIQ